jgi:hypothetical protein
VPCNDQILAHFCPGITSGKRPVAPTFLPFSEHGLVLESGRLLDLSVAFHQRMPKPQVDRFPPVDV